MARTNTQSSLSLLKGKRKPNAFYVEHGSPPKLTRQNAVARKAQFQYRGFNGPIIDLYKKWMVKENETPVDIEQATELPEFADILSYQVDGLAKTESGTTWPIMIKTVFQNARAEAKSIDEIAKRRKNFYLIKDGDDGEWSVRKYSKIWFMCQNTLAVYNCHVMHVIVYNPRNRDMAVVEVTSETYTFKANFVKLQDFFAVNDKEFHYLPLTK